MPSSDIKLDKRRRTYVRLIGDINHALNQALEEEHEQRGLTQSGMAEFLDTDKSFVCRKMNGTSNMTLETFADLAYALNRAVKVELLSRTAQLGANIFGQADDQQNRAAIARVEPLADSVPKVVNTRATATASTTASTAILEST